ncbi:hypothetical protein WN51_02115 [Melipona quadrifasciata]|uniref:Uncharacterized protein n=1 Tax=Melipona quadrifasciata TaxID=166423 RepID=A0A0M8ZYC4_9HYME|nr:hypothetical protein WN51_02115 [Melipona quadrifasciata]
MQRVSPYSWMTQFNKYLVFDGEGPLGSDARWNAKDKGKESRLCVLSLIAFTALQSDRSFYFSRHCLH